MFLLDVIKEEGVFRVPLWIILLCDLLVAQKRDERNTAVADLDQTTHQIADEEAVIDVKQ